MLVLIWIAVAACGDDDVPTDDQGDSDSGSDEMRDGGSGRAGSGGIARLDGGGRRDAGDDAGLGDADVGADEDAGGGQVSCVRDADCNDDNACTEDECAADVCARTAIDPDDGNACTTDSCDPDTGEQHDPVAVDDGDACTTDSCDPGTGVAHAPCPAGLCDTTQACLATTTMAFNGSPALALPTGPGVASDTIQVIGAGSRLWDLDVRTSITHVYSTEVDITLRSPSGTVVTLTTDNGYDSAGVPCSNVFNGTLWNDDANPSGAVPYSVNPGLVFDHPYQQATTATPLVPEEALGAFIGENPNGTWTLTISDDQLNDGGTLTAWGLDVTTIAAAPTITNQTLTQSTAVPIPDETTITSILVVPASASGSRVCSITVSTNVSHTFNSDLAIALTSPSGTIVTLSAYNGGSNDNVFAGTLWDDNANPAGQLPYDANDGLVIEHAYADGTAAATLVPEEALSAFIGETVAGAWTLTIADVSTTDVGMLNSWSLNIGRCMR
jgi:subtilisin-like proprotein convertase family protein